MKQAEFEEWKQHPITQEYLHNIQAEKDSWVRGLVNGNTLRGTSETAEATARAVGVIWGLDQLLEVHVEEEEENVKTS
jgi:hypothetical protein